MIVAMRINLRVAASAWRSRSSIAGRPRRWLLPFVPGVGTTVNDARAWVAFGSFSLQPSEFLKLALVVFCADLLVRRQRRSCPNVRRSLRPVAIVAALAGRRLPACRATSARRS